MNGPGKVTYMEQLCNRLHPSMRLDGDCIQWFRQMAIHCMELIDGKSKESLMWKAIKSIVYRKPNRNLMSTSAHNIDIQPKHLNLDSCQYLLQDILTDYITRAPRYVQETATNTILWHAIILLLFCILLLVVVLFGIVLKRTVPVVVSKARQLTHLDKIFTPEKRMKAVTKRSIRLAYKERQLLQVKRVLRTEDVFTAAKLPVMVVNLSSQLRFVEDIVAGLPLAAGRLYRLQNQYIKVRPMERKCENVQKVLSFINCSEYQLHLILAFDKETGFEDKLALEDIPTRIPIDSKLKVPKYVSTPPLSLIKPLDDEESFIQESHSMEPSAPPLSPKSASGKLRNSCIPMSYSMISGISYCLNSPYQCLYMNPNTAHSNQDELLSDHNQTSANQQDSSESQAGKPKFRKTFTQPRSSPRAAGSSGSQDSTPNSSARGEKPRSSSTQRYVRKSTFIKSRNLTPNNYSPRSYENVSNNSPRPVKTAAEKSEDSKSQIPRKSRKSVS